MDASGSSADRDDDSPAAPGDQAARSAAGFPDGVATGGVPAATLPEWERDRLAKAERLRRDGVEPYARSYESRTHLGEITEAHTGLEPGAKGESVHYRVAGRVMSRREHGKAVFLTL